MQEVGQKEEPACTGGGQPPFEKRGHVTVDAVTSHEVWTRLAGAIEDVDLLLDEESRGEGRQCASFFFARP